jgi:hypothetical protein
MPPAAVEEIVERTGAPTHDFFFLAMATGNDGIRMTLGADKMKV